MEALTLAIVGVMCIACFVVGAKVGQAASNGEKIESPIPNPIKAHKDREARKEADREQDRINTIMQNIENYDGTGRGQKEIPWR